MPDKGPLAMKPIQYLDIGLVPARFRSDRQLHAVDDHWQLSGCAERDFEPVRDVHEPRGFALALFAAK